MIMSGIDPQSKKFTEPPAQIKNEIAALKADKSVPEAEKKEDLAQLEASLKTAKPIQFKENIALVLKYFDQLAPIMQEQDPKVEAQAAAVAKKHGFASLAQYDDVSMNITMIMSGIDPQTKKFTEPPEQIKEEIAALKADKSVPEAEKKEGLAQLEAALKNAKPIQFKENIALVLKYFDQLVPFMQELDTSLRPAD